MFTTTTTETVISQVGMPKHATTTTTTAMNPDGSHSFHIRLLSPVGAEAFEYDYTPGQNNKKGNFSGDIYDTIFHIIKFVGVEFDDLKFAIELVIKSSNTGNSIDNLKILCDKYNRVIKDTLQMNKGTSVQKRITKARPSTELLHQIIQMCYNCSVGEPTKLNKFYEPFSPEVYGETSFQFIQQMIDEFPLNEDDVFIDLGSGIGQVVLQVAAASKCSRCIGIEKAELPSNIALDMEKSFKFWMKWFGKEYSHFELQKGDFFDSKYSETFNSASFIFVNNFAFGPEVDHNLKKKFENLKDGARILSSKAFCSSNVRITERNLNDIGIIMKLKEVDPNNTVRQSVSWTGKPVSYFLHTIDRTELLKYFERQNMKHDQSKKSRTNKSNRSTKGSSRKDTIESSSSTNTSDGSPTDSKDEHIPSKWTRNKWNEFVRVSSTSNDVAASSNHTTPEKCQNSCGKVDADSSASKSSRGRPRKTTMAERSSSSVGNIKTDDENSMASLSESSSKVENKDEQQNEGFTCLRRRGPGRPKKEPKPPPPPTKKDRDPLRGVSMPNLEVLHQKTLESIGDFDTDPRNAPKGSVAQKICISKSTIPIPAVEVTNEELIATDSENLPLISPGSEFSVPLVENPKGYQVVNCPDIEEFMKMLKYSLQSILDSIKCSQHKEDLKERIWNEERRRNELRCQENDLKVRIFEQKQQAVNQTKLKMVQLGLDPISVQEMFNRMEYEEERKLRQNAVFEEMKAQVEKVSAENAKLQAQIEKAADDMRKAEEAIAVAQATEALRRDEERKAAEKAAELEKRIAEEKAAELAAAAASSAAAASTAALIPNGHENSPKRDHVPAPKRTYKELKYKTNRMNLDLHNPVSNDSSENSLPSMSISNSSNSNGKHNDYSVKPTATNSLPNGTAAERMPVNSPHRMEGLFYKAFENPERVELQSSSNNKSATQPTSTPAPTPPTLSVDAAFLTNGHHNNPSNIPSTKSSSVVPIKPPKQATGGSRRSRKPRVETLATKNDRQVVVKNSGGNPTMQIVRTPQRATVNRENSVESIIDSVVNESYAKPPEPASTDKPSIKMKINTKANTTSLLLGSVPADPVEFSNNSISVSSNSSVTNSKRKVSTEKSSSSKRSSTRSQEKKNEAAKAATAAAAVNNSSSTVENGNSVTEPKLPPVKLKLTSNNGSNYQLMKNTDAVESGSSSTTTSFVNGSLSQQPLDTVKLDPNKALHNSSAGYDFHNGMNQNHQYHPHHHNNNNRHHNHNNYNTWNNRGFKSSSAQQPLVHHRKRDHSKMNYYNDGPPPSQSTVPPGFSWTSSNNGANLPNCQFGDGGGDHQHHNSSMPLQNGFDYSSTSNCRQANYENATPANYIPNMSHNHHNPLAHDDPLLLKKAKTDSQVGNAYTNGFYNQNAIY